jgi:methionyl-tRNA synthetase
VNEISEKNYFFRMSKYQSWLIEYIEKNNRFIFPSSRRNGELKFLSIQNTSPMSGSTP